MHANQIWWVLLLWFRKFCPCFVQLQNGHNLDPFRSWTVHGGQKIEAAQKIHASRGGYEMH